MSWGWVSTKGGLALQRKCPSLHCFQTVTSGGILDRSQILVQSRLCCQTGGLTDRSLLLLRLLWLTPTTPSLLPLRSPSKLLPAPKPVLSQTPFFGGNLKWDSTQIWGFFFCLFVYFNKSVHSIFLSPIYCPNELLLIHTWCLKLDRKKPSSSR